MTQTTQRDPKERQRNLLFLSRPDLWPVRPFLPLIRQKPGSEVEYGLLYDVFQQGSGCAGFSATVFLTNLFLLPPNESEFLALPKEVFDNAEEIFDAGWRVD